MNWTEVSGYFDSDLVYKLAIKSAPENATFVEIGTWKGKSTSCMGQLIKKSNKDIKFYAIDTFEGSDESWHQEWIEHLNKNGSSLFLEYEQNLKLCNVYDVVNTIQSTSIEASKHFEDESIDFIFIDASHDYENVLADITAWYPKLKPGGLIAGDDYAPCWGGVIQAVNEYFTNKTIFFLNGNLNHPYSQKVWHWCHFKPKEEVTKMDITLYAIARNEEKNIERFLENSKKFSHTIVVDTGSTDNTIQLLRDAGVEVYEHPQTREEFDFALARNTALSYVKTDWAFSLDFNEDVSEMFVDGLEFVANDVTCLKHHRYDDNGKGEPKESGEVHVRFHRTKNYEWKNAVHEVPNFVPTEEFPVESVVQTNIKITKKVNKSVDKELFYLSICEREYQKDPTNWYYIWFIFNHYYSVKNFEKTLNFGQEFLNNSKPYFDTFRVECFIKCSQVLFQTGNLQLGSNYAFHALSEAMNMGQQYIGMAFTHLLQVGININNPDIVVFASAFSEETRHLPQRKDAIQHLFEQK